MPIIHFSDVFSLVWLVGGGLSGSHLAGTGLQSIRTEAVERPFSGWSRSGDATASLAASNVAFLGAFTVRFKKSNGSKRSSST